MLTRPLDGCSSTLNVTPTATVLTSVGKNTRDRSGPCSFNREVRTIASDNPRTTFSVHVTAAKITVLRKPFVNAGSRKNCRKFSNPIQFQSKRVQRVNAKKKAIAVGVRKKTPNTKAAGT